MALDLSRFAKAFFEEAHEHISSLESLLVEVSLHAPNTETLNAIFRAVHSVKGGAAAFGHMDLSEFTHDFESILDRVRKGKILLTKAMVNDFLNAGDVMRKHLHALEQETAPDLAPMQSLRATLLAMSEEVVLDQTLAEEPAAPAIPRFKVLIYLEKSQYGELDALNALNADVAGLGVVTDISTQSIDERLLSYSFNLDTDIGDDELRESLEFLVPADAIHISAHERRGSRVKEPVIREDDRDGRYGFFDSGAHETGVIVSLQSPVLHTADSDIQLESLVDASSIRVNVVKVDQLINLVGELVIAEAMLTQSAEGVDPDGQTRLAPGLAQLQRNTRDLQNAILAIRMLPISFVFSRLPRLTRDIAEKLGKNVELQLLGEATELDKSVIEKIADPLTHLVRNAIDHGIETPEERTRLGKHPIGLLTVAASHRGGNIVITVSDDGAGLSRQRILAKARELGLEGGGDTWDDEEVWQLIFTPGFSTAAAVTNVSGRGVGMDVVWQNVHILGGKIEIESIPGRGTSMTIRLPLTLAILEGMSISVSGETYILPLANIAQSLQSSMSEMSTVNGREVVRIGEEYVPITSLPALFNLPARDPEASDFLVVLEMDERRAAIRADELLGQHQVVLKSIEANFRRVNGVSGATILGDGRVALILDATYLISVAYSVAHDHSASAMAVEVADGH